LLGMEKSMTPEVKGRIQAFLLILIVVAGVRTGWILWQRHSDQQQSKAQKQNAPLNPDYYVTPKKLYPYDLKSAKQLTQQPLWVKEGYKYTCYPYNPATHHTDFEHDAGTLGPLEKLKVTDVVLDTSPEKGQKQVMAVFERDGKHYAFPIGLNVGGDYKIYSDEIFFYQDPKELYKHWPADVWSAIDNHQVKPGMNELQADFAIGMGRPESSGDSDKVVNYPNGGKPLTVIYRNGKAVEVKPGTPS